MVDMNSGTNATPDNEKYIEYDEQGNKWLITKYSSGVVTEECLTNTYIVTKTDSKSQFEELKIKKTRRNNKSIPPKRRDMKF